ncbi:MAG: response regulator [Deltaproteobacteria bacterium]|nr:response regulator [Deltaproteobacteria bacterium]
MEKEFTILIADRNPHVRELLKREMMAEGYRVRLAKNGREVLKQVYDHEPLDLLILDLDLPDAGEVHILENIEDRIPTLPVVVHSFVSDYANQPAVLSTAVFVEKKGSSIESLTKVVFEVLHKITPKSTNVSE